MIDLDLRPWSRLAALVVSVLLLMALYAEMATAQAQALPYSATNIPVSTGNPTFSVVLDLLTAPKRPQLRITATPDAGHQNMTLEIDVDGCPFFGDDNCFWDDDDQNGVPINPTWHSNSAPGPVEWVAPIYQCVPAPTNASLPATGTTQPECTIEVTATSFGSGGSPATFDLQIVGETLPATGTVHKVVDPLVGTTGEQDLPLGRVEFCTDAANFRWIYDEEDNDVVETFHPITAAPLGKCTGLVSEGGEGGIFGPDYIYDYLGSPSYVGFDCCTWQVDSPDTDTTGSGQALFYINLGLGAQPPDSDEDGFFDPCDNCVNVPNGPFLGTCVTESGSTVGAPCTSDLQCTGGQFCSMAQEDNDFDPEEGLVCLPEPGATALLASGVLCLIGLERRRRNASLTASC
jgi:hypothetical protein